MLFGILLLIPSAATEAKIDINSAGDLLGQVADEKRTGLSQDDLSTSSGKLIQKLLSAVGIVFLVLMIYAGILWMSARGNEDQVSKARNTLIAAIIGLTVIVAAYAITSFILTRLQRAAQGSGEGGTNQQGGPSGCCMDRVNAGWACRVTSQLDCQTRGTTTEPGDDFGSAADWRFIEGMTTVPTCILQCQNN